MYIYDADGSEPCREPREKQGLDLIIAGADLQFHVSDDISMLGCG
jgi:hypothetical protein